MRRFWDSQIRGAALNSRLMGQSRYFGIFQTTYLWDSKSLGTQVPRNPNRSHGTPKSHETRVPTCPKAWHLAVLEISVPGLSQRYLCQSQASQVPGPGISIPFPIPEFEYQGIFLCTVVRTSDSEVHFDVRYKALTFAHPSVTPQIYIKNIYRIPKLTKFLFQVTELENLKSKNINIFNPAHKSK